MSLNKIKSAAIDRYILNKIDASESPVKPASEAFDVSVQTVYKHIRDLQSAGLIKRDGKLKYELISDVRSISLGEGELKTDEAVLFDRYISSYTDELPENVRRIWMYSVTEMLNNVKEHSQASRSELIICRNAVSLSVIIYDNGIGIFRKIKEKFGLADEDEAIRELFKGKLTTDTEKHSGEGIFFTSRMMDEFAILSDGRIFTHNKFDSIDEKIGEIRMLAGDSVPIRGDAAGGTLVFMKLADDTSRTTRTVFDKFADVENGFRRTEIAVANLFGNYPVSRSQAKRLCNRLDEFDEVMLDFDGVDDIGQGFADELFRVFVNAHGDIKLNTFNTNENVRFMMTHVGAK